MKMKTIVLIIVTIASVTAVASRLMLDEKARQELCYGDKGTQAFMTGEPDLKSKCQDLWDAQVQLPRKDPRHDECNSTFVKLAKSDPEDVDLRDQLEGRFFELDCLAVLDIKTATGSDNLKPIR